MTTDRTPPMRDDPDPDRDVETIAHETKRENPDPTTRREAFELGLMEADESEEGETVEVVSDDELEEER
jgi:hypothetical protein